MSAVGRQWFCRSLVALVSAGLVASALSEEFPSQLGAEIERRFTTTPGDAEPERIIDSAFPLTREIETGRGTIQPLKLNFEFENSQPSDRLEGIESMPRPTLVE